MHTAVREHRPKFRLLHAKDKSPIRYERVCQRDGKPVAWEDLVKGYEYERGRYVVLTKEDFKAAALEKDRRVQVTDFVPATRSTIATSISRTTCCPTRAASTPTPCSRRRSPRRGASASARS